MRCFPLQDCHTKLKDLFTNQIYLIGIIALVVAVIMVSTKQYKHLSLAVCTAAAGACPHSCSARCYALTHGVFIPYLFFFFYKSEQFISVGSFVICVMVLVPLGLFTAVKKIP